MTSSPALTVRECSGLGPPTRRGGPTVAGTMSISPPNGRYAPSIHSLFLLVQAKVQWLRGSSWPPRDDLHSRCWAMASTGRRSLAAARTGQRDIHRPVQRTGICPCHASVTLPGDTVAEQRWKSFRRPYQYHRRTSPPGVDMAYQGDGHFCSSKSMPMVASDTLTSSQHQRS